MFQTAATFLAIAAVFGLFLRWIAIHPIPGINVRFLTHAHSHIAFMGWIFNAFIAIAATTFLEPRFQKNNRRLFLLFQLANLGMLATFPWQGYAALSIGFTTLHMLSSIAFATFLWKSAQAPSPAHAFLKISLVFLFLSSLGPFALGPLAAFDLRNSHWYALAIYFYLHFQYNGWFLFFLIAAVLKQLQIHQLAFSEPRASNAWKWLAIGTTLNVSLSTLWIQPPLWVHAIALLSGCAQLIGLSQLLASLRSAKIFTSLSPLALRLAQLSLAALCAKFFFQLLATLPGLISFSIDRFSAIGFLHLVFLGCVTPALIAWAIQEKWIRPSRLLKPAIVLFIFGLFATETILFVQALLAWLQLAPLPASGLLIFLASLAIAGATLLLLRPALKS